MCVLLEWTSSKSSCCWINMMFFVTIHRGSKGTLMQWVSVLAYCQHYSSISQLLVGKHCWSIPSFTCCPLSVSRTSLLCLQFPLFPLRHSLTEQTFLHVVRHDKGIQASNWHEQWGRYVCLGVRWKTATLWCLLLDPRTHSAVICRWIKVVLSLISPVCFSSMSVMHRHKPKHQMGTMVQRANCHLHKKDVSLMALAAMKWLTAWFGIWALQERGILRALYHIDPRVYSMIWGQLLSLYTTSHWSIANINNISIGHMMELKGGWWAAQKESVMKRNAIKTILIFSYCYFTKFSVWDSEDTLNQILKTTSDHMWPNIVFCFLLCSSAHFNSYSYNWYLRLYEASGSLNLVSWH